MNNFAILFAAFCLTFLMVTNWRKTWGRDVHPWTDFLTEVTTALVWAVYFHWPRQP